MPVFTLKEIEKHREKCGKGQAILKTSDRGRKFKNERYLSADDIFTKACPKHFMVRAKCRASMKQTKRNIVVTLCKETGLVLDWRRNVTVLLEI